jgi:hypothetical protein
MSPVLPVNSLESSQPQVELVDQSRGLQGMVGPFAPHAASRSLVKFAVYAWSQLLECGLVAVAPCLQEFRDFVFHVHHG